jgi:hypothetical protein
MAAFLFTCPRTNLKVQHWLDDDEDVPENEYESHPVSGLRQATSATDRRLGTAPAESVPSLASSLE